MAREAGGAAEGAAVPGHHRRYSVRALFGGVATPPEAAGVGALFCLVLVAVIYRMWQPDKMWHIFRDSTRESVMTAMIIATSELFGYMMSSLYVTQEVAAVIAALEVNRRVLDGDHQRVPAGGRLLPAAGGDHPDDRAGAQPDVGAVGFRSLTGSR